MASATPLAPERPAPPWPLSRQLALLVPALVAWWLIYLNLAPAAAWATQRLLRLAPDSPLGSAVEFLLYEAPKVLLLLALVVFGPDTGSSSVSGSGRCFMK